MLAYLLGVHGYYNIKYLVFIEVHKSNNTQQWD